jgi:O-antigen/teichoic acid export membrane protein
MCILDPSAESGKALKGEPLPVHGELEGASGSNSPELFATEHLQKDLKGRTVRGGAVTLVSQGGNFLLSLGSTAVLARLLTPADFGLIAMATALTALADMFKDAGLSSATVQRADITHEQISTLFWINVTLSLLLTLAVAALAPGVAWLYSEPRLTYITLSLSTLFILGGLTTQHRALLRRQMRYGTLAWIAMVSKSFGIATAIVAAAIGAHHWALVSMLAVTALVNAILVWIVSPWRPGPPVRGSGVKPMLAFGLGLSGSSFMSFLRRNIDGVLIGMFYGTVPLALYKKAYQILLLPIMQINAPISGVAIPTLSRLQNSPIRFRAAYCRAMTLVTAINMPVIAFFGVMAHEVVQVVLGEQWVEAAAIFLALVPAACMGTLNRAGGWVFVSLGRSGKQFLANTCMTIAAVLAVLVGLAWGPHGVAVAVSITYVLCMPALFAYAFQDTPLRLRDLGNSIWRPAVAAFAAALLTGVLNHECCVFVPSAGLRLSIGAFLFGAVYTASWFVLFGGTAAADTAELFSLLRPASWSPVATQTKRIVIQK